MKPLTESSIHTDRLAELDGKIGRIRHALENGVASEFAKNQLAELLDLRRKMVLGQFGLKQ